MIEQTSFTRHFQPSASLLEARTKQLESNRKRNVKSILIYRNPPLFNLRKFSGLEGG